MGKKIPICCLFPLLPNVCNSIDHPKGSSASFVLQCCLEVDKQSWPSHWPLLMEETGSQRLPGPFGTQMEADNLS